MSVSQSSIRPIDVIELSSPVLTFIAQPGHRTHTHTTSPAVVVRRTGHKSSHRAGRHRGFLWPGRLAIRRSILCVSNLIRPLPCPLRVAAQSIPHCFALPDRRNRDQDVFSVSLPLGSKPLEWMVDMTVLQPVAFILCRVNHMKAYHRRHV